MTPAPARPMPMRELIHTAWCSTHPHHRNTPCCPRRRGISGREAMRRRLATARAVFYDYVVNDELDACVDGTSDEYCRAAGFARWSHHGSMEAREKHSEFASGARAERLHGLTDTRPRKAMRAMNSRVRTYPGLTTRAARPERRGNLRCSASPRASAPRSAPPAVGIVTQ